MKETKIISQIVRASCASILCMALLVSGSPLLMAQTTPTAPAPAQTTAVKIPADQLESMVAPIALYPDKLLAQVLVASTYPLELVQLHQWLEKNTELQKDQKKLADAVAKQPWDASIQAMAPLPDVVKWLAGDIQWTTDLGNAFLAQQKDVMDAVQRMRTKAEEKGNLKSNEQMKVEKQVVESQSVIVIEQSNPQVIYVPSYNPSYVYGPLPYPYPPIYYPPYGWGAVAAGAIGFGVGVAIGAAWGGGWGWGCGWGGGDVDINVNNNFNRNTNIQGGNRNNINSGNRGQGQNKWQHNPTHRGGAPYGDRGTANKFGGTARGDSLANRQSGARNQIGQSGGNLGSANRGGAGVSTRDSAPRGGGVGDRSGGNLGGNRPSAGTRDMGSRSGGSNSIGNRSMGSNSSMGNRSSGFGGSGGWSGSSARSSSSRGMSSMSSSRGGFSGGGMSRGGGGGMSRGGGGGRRR